MGRLKKQHSGIGFDLGFQELDGLPVCLHDCKNRVRSSPTYAAHYWCLIFILSVCNRQHIVLLFVPLLKKTSKQ